MNLWATWWETWGPIFVQTDVSVVRISLKVSLGVLGTHLGAHKHREVMYTMSFNIFRSVFARRDAAPGVFLGLSYGDQLAELGPMCFAHRCFSVSLCSLLYDPWWVLGT